MRVILLPDIFGLIFVSTAWETYSGLNNRDSRSFNKQSSTELFSLPALIVSGLDRSRPVKHSLRHIAFSLQPLLTDTASFRTTQSSLSRH